MFGKLDLGKCLFEEKIFGKITIRENFCSGNRLETHFKSIESRAKLRRNKLYLLILVSLRWTINTKKVVEWHHLAIFFYFNLTSLFFLSFNSWRSTISTRWRTEKSFWRNCDHFQRLHKTKELSGWISKCVSGWRKTYYVCLFLFPRVLPRSFEYIWYFELNLAHFVKRIRDTSTFSLI